MNYAYKPVRKADLSFLHQLFLEKEYDSIFHEGQTTLQSWEERFEQIKDFQIIYDDDTPIGVLNLKVQEDVDILLIVLVYQLIGRGIGSKVFEDVFDTYGSKVYNVTVKESNNRAINFYKKLGFYEVGKEMIDSGENGKHMYLNLSLTW